MGAHALQTTAEITAVLRVVNDPAVDFITLDEVIGLDRRAARRIVERRNGDDGVAGTADDQLFASIDALDAVPYVGKSALGLLLDYARAQGYVQAGASDGSARERAILAVVNDPAVNFVVLDRDIGLDRRAARNIATYRDSNPIDTLSELDSIKYVGQKAIALIFEWAVANGYFTAEPDRSASVVFSPQAYANSHNARIADVIDAANDSIDIAMYSLSDARISDALEAAVLRGVRVRFIFETANADRKVDSGDRWNTRSGRLEAAMINVRWVNKIMHHKFMIVDGPRDDLGAATAATIVSGSGNWSFGAATRYDENTLFLTGHAELALRLQREFNRMWSHSRDFVYDGSLAYELSDVTIFDDDITDDPSTDVYFTSDNFTVSGDTFRILRGVNTVSDAVVAAIGAATTSIHVASGHLRSRPIAEALMAKSAANPGMDIRVYLDGQEYISASYQRRQLSERDDCIEAAGTSVAKVSQCNERGFLFGYTLGQAGIDVRYKYYSYRWHYSYAEQMHHKLLIIDGDELWTGSYNLSDNAEHNTFENMFVLRGPEFSALVGAYERNFESIWGTGRGGSRYSDLFDAIQTESSIPLVFESMALDHDEITDLKGAVRANCSRINEESFRKEPEKHRFCPR